MIYIINSYGEYGPENIRICDKLEVCGRILREIHEEERAYVKDQKWLPEHIERHRLGQIEEGDALEKALLGNKVGTYNLSHGWGGYQLHIVELEG